MVWPYNWNVSLYVHWLSVTYNISDWICTLIWISRRTLLPTYFLCHLQMNNGSRTAAAAQSVPKDDFGAKPVWYHSPKKEKGRKWPLKMKNTFWDRTKGKNILKFDDTLELNFGIRFFVFFAKKIYFTHIFQLSQEVRRKSRVHCGSKYWITNSPFIVRWRPWPPFPDFDNFFPIFLCWIFLQKLLWL